MIQLRGCVVSRAERQPLSLNVGDRPRRTAHLNNLTGLRQGRGSYRHRWSSGWWRWPNSIAVDTDNGADGVFGHSEVRSGPLDHLGGGGVSLGGVGSGGRRAEIPSDLVSLARSQQLLW